MKQGLILLMLATIGQAQATTFFEPCKAALETPPFKALKTFLAGKPELAQPDTCFRLNDREFLLTVPDAGRRVEGLYSFDAQSRQYDLVDSMFSPGLKVRLEFDGPGHKHFALLESQDMNAGDWSTTYEALYLTPKSSGRVFARQLLVETHQGGDGPCPPGGKTASSLEKLQLENEDTDHMQLVFNLKLQRCSDGKTTHTQRRFSWTGKGFTQL